MERHWITYLQQKKIQQIEMCRKEGRAMARTNNEISVNKGVLDSAANMVKLGIRWMTEKDSLSAGDTVSLH